MTKQRNDEHSTEFGLWLREQSEIDSGLGFVCTNLDYIWKNYKTGEWLLIEEKRHYGNIAFWQEKIFNDLDLLSRFDPKYKGFYLIVFENTSPKDGLIWINKKESSKEDLIKLLKFEGLK